MTTRWCYYSIQAGKTTGILNLDGCACFHALYTYGFVSPYMTPLLSAYCMISCPRIYDNSESLSLHVGEWLYGVNFYLIPPWCPLYPRLRWPFTPVFTMKLPIPQAFPLSLCVLTIIYFHSVGHIISHKLYQHFMINSTVSTLL